MTDCRGREGEDAHRERVRETLRFWKEGRTFTPEDLLSVAWSGKQPWVVKVQGEALQILVKVAALERKPGEGLGARMGLSSSSTFITLVRLDFEGRLHHALEMIRHPEIYGPVGDVLDLGWTRERELEEWIEASDRSWSAYEGVKRLLQGLRYDEEPIPEALARWSMDVAAGDRRQPSKGHRPASQRYRDGDIVKTIRSLTAGHLPRRARTKMVTQEMACQLVAEELHLGFDTVRKIWQRDKSFRDPWLLAPALRPF